MNTFGINPDRTLLFNAKVKLHGTNAGIRITPDGVVVAQSRKDELVNGRDNAGFAAWVKENEVFFQAVAHPTYTMVLFGEWCGQSIQKGVAVSQIGMKIFAIFSVRYYLDGRCVKELLNPEDIVKGVVCDTTKSATGAYPKLPHNLYVLPWYHQGLEVNFNDSLSQAAAAEVMHEMVLSVEAEDPWIKSIFNVSGVGEGLVWYPAPNEDIPFHEDRDVHLMFKTKGEKHSTTKVKTLTVKYTVEQVAKIDDFVSTFVTDARCEQGLTEACGGEVDMTKIGQFIGWMCQDIKAESVQEVEASEFKWKDLNKAVVVAVKEWYTNK
jgi:hypothetical protein